jgi:HAD superfamily hydrolase (TIGR01549 family)
MLKSSATFITIPIVSDDAAGAWGVLFDVDETLILTSALERLRKSRKWSEVYASFGETLLPPGTVRFIEAVRRLAKVAVVTKSPRPYAEKILKFHGVSVPVAIAYHDVARHKPHPEALIKAAAKLGVSVGRCIHVGDHADDAAAANAAKCFSVEVCWASSPSSSSACTTWDSVYKKIVNIIGGSDGKHLQ